MVVQIGTMTDFGVYQRKAEKLDGNECQANI